MAEPSSTARSTSLEEVPELYEECMHKIFSHMPATEIEASVKCLSKSWKKFTSETSFIEENLSHSRPGLLIRSNKYPREDGSVRVRYFTVDNGVFKFTNVLQADCFTMMTCPQGFSIIDGRILESCDGISLVLFSDDNPTTFLFAANVVTRQLRMIYMPDNGTLWRQLIHFGIGRVPHTGEVKVLCAIHFDDRGFRWCISTINGADQTWRELNLPIDFAVHPIMNHRRADIISCSGVIYLDRSSGSQHTTFAVDLSNESVHQIKVPEYNSPQSGECETVISGSDSVPPMDFDFLVMRGNNEYFLPRDARFVIMGDKVSFIVPDQQGNGQALRIFILTDFRNSRWEVWGKYIHPEINKSFIEDNAVPIAWLDDGKVLMCMVAYYVNTGKKRQVPNIEISRDHTVTCHTNSLVWLN